MEEYKEGKLKCLINLWRTKRMSIKEEFPLFFKEIMKLVSENTAVGSDESLEAVNKVRKKYGLDIVTESSSLERTMIELETAIKEES